MRPYKLANNTHACVTATGAVLLDLKADAYFGLDAQQSQALAEVIEGWPEAPQPTPSSHDALAFARSLCERGLLSPAPEGRPAHAAEIQMCNDEFIAWDEMARYRTTAGHLFNFARAVLVTLVLLQGLSLNSAVRHCRKIRHCESPTAEAFDVEATRELISAYSHLRTIFFIRRGRCLLDSMALFKFLSYYGIYPRWFIGVRQRPFAAHSWVQHEQWVLNGTPAFVRMYRPILVV